HPTQIECRLSPITHFSQQYRNRARRSALHHRPHMLKFTQSALSNTTTQSVAVSTNWSGYSSFTSLQHPATGSVTSVIGSWTIPTLSPSTQTTFSSAWVGIDGFSDQTVEQIGTEQDWYNGKQVNYAWFEMYPQFP